MILNIGKTWYLTENFPTQLIVKNTFPVNWHDYEKSIHISTLQTI